jgi:hypothetical protein
MVLTVGFCAEVILVELVRLHARGLFVVAAVVAVSASSSLGCFRMAPGNCKKVLKHIT